jgi:hypothetical protein
MLAAASCLHVTHTPSADWVSLVLPVLQAVFSRPVIALGSDWGSQELQKDLVRKMAAAAHLCLCFGIPSAAAAAAAVCWALPVCSARSRSRLAANLSHTDSCRPGVNLKRMRRCLSRCPAAPLAACAGSQPTSRALTRALTGPATWTALSGGTRASKPTMVSEKHICVYFSSAAVTTQNQDAAAAALHTAAQPGDLQQHRAHTPHVLTCPPP